MRTPALSPALRSLPPDAAEPDDDYRAALAWVWSFSASEPTVASDRRQRRVERMRFLLDRLGNPQHRFPSILVGGTKGKGSTVAMAAAALHAGGHRTGRYTSPHLVNWRERTVVDGAPILPAEVVALRPKVAAALAELPPELGTPSTFEVGTLIALEHFARQEVRVAVVEVGVGGRADATNGLEPVVSAITPISYDHLATLGSTLTGIATEKAGILRTGRPAILGPQSAEPMSVLEAEARRLRAPLAVVGRDWCWAPVSGEQTPGLGPIRVWGSGDPSSGVTLDVPLIGAHQRDNAATAVAVLHALARVEPGLDVTESALVEGLAGMHWPGRLQVVNQRPTVVLDGAHNAASAVAIRRAIESAFAYRRLLLVLGLSEGKDAEGVVGALAPLSSWARVTRAHHERAVPPAGLADLVRIAAPAADVRVAASLAQALEEAVREAGPDDLVLVTGSLFLVGEALTWAGQAGQ